MCDGVWPEILSVVTDVSSWGDVEGKPESATGLGSEPCPVGLCSCASRPSAPSTCFLWTQRSHHFNSGGLS